MPDFNPDKERHHKHKFIVQRAFENWRGRLDGGVATSKGVLKPDAQGRMVVRDASLAREIQQENPHELVVTRMQTDHPSDRGHRYVFTVPEMPWKRQHREAEAQESQKAQAEKPAEDTDDGQVCDERH